MTTLEDGVTFAVIEYLERVGEMPDLEELFKYYPSDPEATSIYKTSGTLAFYREVYHVAARHINTNPSFAIASVFYICAFHVGHLPNNKQDRMPFLSELCRVFGGVDPEDLHDFLITVFPENSIGNDDIHSENIGRRPNGQLVIFDPVS